MMNREAREELYDPTNKYDYIIESVTPNQGLKAVSKATYKEAVEIAKIYAQRNWSENIPPKYGKIKITKGGIIQEVFTYNDKSPFLAVIDKLYDPKRKAHKGSWLDFVKAHKNMRTPKGLLDLKAISKLWKGQKALDPAPRKSSAPPKSWFSAMYTGIKTRSDVRNPAAIVNNIWKKLTPAKRSVISAQAKTGKTFKYDLPLPDDKQTKGTGTLRMVKPFKLAEVQVNLSAKDYLHALKSGLFSKMKRNDGTIALVARCKSEHKNCNIFVDKVK